MYLTTRSALFQNRVIVTPIGRSTRHLKKHATLTCRHGAFRFTENDEEFRLCLDVPGVKASKLEVKVQDGFIRVSGQRKGESKFVKRFAIDSVDATKLKAHLADGVLILTGSKKKPMKSKSIPVIEGPYSTETDEDFIISIDVQGVRADDICVELKDGVLGVSATRRIKEGETPTLESRFFKEFAVDANDVATPQLKAILDSGELVLTAPRRIKCETQTVLVTEEALDDDLRGVKDSWRDDSGKADEQQNDCSSPSSSSMK